MMFRLTLKRLTLKGLLLPGTALLLAGALAGCGGGGGGGAGTGGDMGGGGPSVPSPVPTERAALEGSIGEIRGVLTSLSGPGAPRVGANIDGVQAQLDAAEDALDDLETAEADILYYDAVLDGLAGQEGDVADSAREQAMTAREGAMTAAQTAATAAATAAEMAMAAADSDFGLLAWANIPDNPATMDDEDTEAVENNENTIRVTAILDAMKHAIDVHKAGIPEKDTAVSTAAYFSDNLFFSSRGTVSSATIPVPAEAVRPSGFMVQFDADGELRLAAAGFSGNVGGSQAGVGFTLDNFDRRKELGNLGDASNMAAGSLQNINFLGNLGDFQGYGLDVRGAATYVHMYTDRQQPEVIEAIIHDPIEPHTRGGAQLVGGNNAPFTDTTTGNYDAIWYDDGDPDNPGIEGRAFCIRPGCLWDLVNGASTGYLFQRNATPGRTVPDNDYMVFGVWLRTSSISNTGAGSANTFGAANNIHVGAYHTGSILFGRNNSADGPIRFMRGTATFEGPATGLYANTSGGSPRIDYFDGTVTLRANFDGPGSPGLNAAGDGYTTVNDPALGTIGGVVDVTSLGGNPHSFQIELQEALIGIPNPSTTNYPKNLGAGADIEGAAIFGGHAGQVLPPVRGQPIPDSDFTGSWSGVFHGTFGSTYTGGEADTNPNRIRAQSTKRPTGASGVFGVYGADGTDAAGQAYIGAFGAHPTSPFGEGTPYEEAP